MTTELRFLAATVILGLLHLIMDPHLISFQLGYRDRSFELGPIQTSMKEK
jgi:hypothetical protein